MAFQNKSEPNQKQVTHLVIWNARLGADVKSHPDVIDHVHSCLPEAQLRCAAVLSLSRYLIPCCRPVTTAATDLQVSPLISYILFNLFFVHGALQALFAIYLHLMSLVPCDFSGRFQSLIANVGIVSASCLWLLNRRTPSPQMRY